jgi:hypothetical protein
MKDFKFVLFYFFSVGVSTLIAQTDYNTDEKEKNGV